MTQPAPECPCGSGRRHAECCGLRHEGEAQAETAGPPGGDVADDAR